MSETASAFRHVMIVFLAAAACGFLASCDDGSELETQIEGESERRVVVSADVQAFRQEVIDSAAFMSPDYASRVRDHFHAFDAGERSKAVAALGGARRVRDELRAAETYHYAHKLDACIADNFGFKEPGRQARFLQRLADGSAGKQLIAEARRSDPDGYAFDLSGYGNDPGQLQRVAAAYDTLSLQWKSLANKGSYGDAYRLFARTFVHLAAASGGKCTPNPKLIPLLDPMPS